jgi:lipopolysaccharide/colanic/teichoic acid biosynthesis glycosyltransferase
MSNFSSNHKFSITPQFPSGFTLKVTLFIVITIAWTGLWALLNPQAIHMEAFITFGVLSALLSIWFLEVFDHFNSFYPVAGPDALLTLIVALPIAAMMAKYVVLTFTGLAVTRYREILLETPIICLIAYVSQVLSGVVFVRSGARRRLCILTSREEAANVINALRSQKLSRYYELIYLDDLKKLTKVRGLTWIVISRSEMRQFEKNESVISAMLSGTLILDHRELIARLRGHLDLGSLDLWMFLTRSTKRSMLGRAYYSSKMFIEPLLALVLLIVLFPFLILVGLGVKWTSPGPVLYGQQRLGYQGRPFKLWKFRSMRFDAESQGHRWSAHGDPRVTRFGSFLRKCRIDELPQLWNILRGEMSFIGPRPERPEFYAELDKQIPLFPIRLLARPGITGWAQVMGGYAATSSQTRRKLEYDLFYLQRMSPKMDAIIALKTLAVALRSIVS